MATWSEETVEAVSEAISASCANPYDKARAALSAISNSKEVREWQSIESAPKMETILVCYPDSDTATAAWYCDYEDAWWPVYARGIHKLNPTHWMPLPTPPTEADND